MNTTQPETSGVVAPPPVIYLTSLALAFGANAISPHRITARSDILYVVGTMFILLSGALARWAFVVMRKQDTSANPRQQSNALATEGPFKLSRNPIYVAMTGLYFGMALLGNSLWPLLFFVLLLATMHWGVVLREERYLTQRFGEAYLDYQSRTRRWL